MLDITIIDHYNQLHEHRHGIDQIASLHKPPNMHFSYGYVSAHLKTFPEDRLKIFIMHNAGALVGFAALSARPDAPDMWRFAAQHCLGYSGVLAHPDFEDEVYLSLLSYVDAHRSEFSLFDAYPLRNGPSFTKFWTAANQIFAGRCKVFLFSDAPYIDPMVGRENWLATRKKKTYPDALRCERRLKEMGDLRTLVIGNNVPKEEIAAATDIIIEMHKKRYRDSRFAHETDGLSPEYFIKFYKELAEHYAGTGELELSFLTLDRRPIAAHFGIVHNSWRYYFTPVYDQEFEKLSPGKILLCKLIDDSFARNIVFDFQNDFDAYKADWLTHVEKRFIVRMSTNGKYPI